MTNFTPAKHASKSEENMLVLYKMIFRIFFVIYARWASARIAHSALPRTVNVALALNDQLYPLVINVLLSDRKVKLQEIADILKISKGNVFKVVHENLSMKKLYSKWVPRLLTVEQKQQRIHDLVRCLKLFTRNKKDFLRRYITMNETWIHHFTPESKRASAEWRGEGESRPKRPKTQQSAGKASVFWDMHGMLLIGFLPKGQTINSDYYIDLLDRLEDAIKRKRPHMAKKKPLFQQDNENDGEIERSTIRIDSTPPIFTRSGPIRLLLVCRSQKDATDVRDLAPMMRL